MKHVIVVADKVNDAGIAILREDPAIEVVNVAGDSDALRTVLSRAAGLLVRSDTQVTAQLIDQAPSLRVIGRAGIGIDNIDVQAATRRGIAVLNAPGANTVSAAEHALALLLALVRRIPWAVQSMREGQWERKAFGGTELRGKTLGVVGLGRIGGHLAGIARAFGMQVLAHDPYLSEDRARELRVELVPIDDLLQRADVISLHLPLTEQTRGIIDQRRLALLKPTAVLVNTARGGLVNEAALVEALDAGRLAGAAVDVFEEEPLPADSPLRRCQKLMLTPHLAASTIEAQERVSLEICSAVRDALVTGDVGSAVNVPGVTGDAMTRFSDLMELARRLGRLSASLVGGRIQGVEVHYGGPDDDAPRPATLAALEGVLAAMGVAPVTLINAQQLAKERSIAVSRRAGQPLSGFETTLGVTVQANGATVSVTGAVIGDRIRARRIVRIDGFAVDVPAEGCVLVLQNRDVPGVIGRVGSLLGDAGINIGAYHQARRTDASDALAAIVVDHAPSPEVLQRLAELPDITGVRFADLDGAR